MRTAGLDEVGVLERAVVKHARAAFLGGDRLAAEWRALNFLAEPDFDRAIAEYDGFVRLLTDAGVDLCFLPADDGVGLDSLYVRDATVLVPGGLVSCAMGKPLRAAEPEAQRVGLAGAGLAWTGRISAPGRLEGGDVVWFDASTVAIGRGYRTNDDGIAQLAAYAGGGVTVLTVPLPHWRGPADVFHLMSMVSPIDRDLVVVYAPLLPVPFRDWLVGRGYELIEVPDEEFDSMGTNVLALGRRRCVMLEGNPVTRRRLEAAGAEVLTYEGREISLKGGGGPTCLTRPLVRSWP